MEAGAKDKPAKGKAKKKAATPSEGKAKKAAATAGDGGTPAAKRQKAPAAADAKAGKAPGAWLCAAGEAAVQPGPQGGCAPTPVPAHLLTPVMCSRRCGGAGGRGV